MKSLIRIFLNGLLALIPLILTIYIIVWLISLFESIFGKVILFLIPDAFYIPGMGILVGIGLIFLAGIMVQTWGLRTLYRTGELLIEKFPLIGDIYSTLKEFMQYILQPSKQEIPDQVVMVDLHGYRLLGIVTCNNFKDAPVGMADKDMIAVYLPMSYQIGGYTVYIQRNLVKPIPMSKKAAMQWTLTAGISQSKS